MKPTPCHIYARFSPRPNAAECESIEYQVRLCEEHARREGWSIAGVYPDAARSGGDRDRPALMEAIGNLKRGHILLVHKLDRLSRDILHALTLEEAIKRRGARLVSVSGEGTDEEEHLGRLVRSILHSVNEWQRQINARRTSEAMRSHQAAGRAMNGNPPLGLMRSEENPAALVPCPAEEALIARAIEIVALNEYSLRSIPRRLFEEGHHRNGAPIDRRSLVRALEARGIDLSHYRRKPSQ